MGPKRISVDLGEIARAVHKDFEEERRVLSFDEYLDLFASDPVAYSRDAARYLRDVFDHYGKEEVKRPWGTVRRYNLFSLPWLGDEDARRDGLVGQEAVQGELYRVLSNFVREGRPNRLPLLHGPNGSAKSTLARCLMLALEDYSERDEGALYRFHWVFPNNAAVRGSIGFGDQLRQSSNPLKSYAHLPEDQIDARLFVEIRDHPLLLIPVAQRGELLERLYKEAGATEPPSTWLLRGTLAHKNRQIFDALLANYEGRLEEVLRHVQVERYFISRRYRTGAVTVGPQLSVDAGERQVTADRSLGSLPSSLKAVSLFEAFGELIDASGGLLEFSDLLKRPLDAFKYLQLTVETGEVALTSQNVEINCVMLASANEGQLEAFRQHHEFESFRGRLELVRTPYLRSWHEEQAIYDAQIVPQIRKHVAPHATQMAAMFAVLTRMRRPDPDKYESTLRKIVRELTAADKMDLYADGVVPERFDADSAKLLKAAIGELYSEGESYTIYEGSIGASPREMRTVLLDASQDFTYASLSPFAVLEQLDRLCQRTSEYIWLQEEKLEGGYHDHEEFRELLRNRLLDMLEDEFRVVSGLVDETRYSELFERYINHVSNWVKSEKVRNPLTGDFEDPDERLMEEVENLLKSPDDAEQLRHSLINAIAAWAIDHPDQAITEAPIFAETTRKLRDAVFEERKGAIAKLCRDVVVLTGEEADSLEPARRTHAEEALERLKQRYGYNEASARDAAAALMRERFAEALS